MKVIAYDRLRPGVTMETIRPYLPEEAAHAWRLWKEGVVRENYSRVDEPGVVLVFEAENADEARRMLSEFPLTKAGYLEWFCIPCTVPFPLESMFSEAALSRVKMNDEQLEWTRGQPSREPGP